MYVRMSVKCLKCSLLWPHSEVTVHNCCTCETSAEVAHYKSDYGFWFRRFNYTPGRGKIVPRNLTNLNN